MFILRNMSQYLSCFVNSNINGKLIMGIKDDGEYISIRKITIDLF